MLPLIEADDPWPWLLVSAFFLGGAASLLAKSALMRSRGRRGRAVARSIVGMLFLALSVLAATGLVVFSGRSLRFDRILLIGGLLALSLGLFSGLFPRAFGIPLAVVFAAAVAAVAIGILGWIPIAARHAVATLTPFTVTAAGWEGELAVEDRDTVPIAQRLQLPQRDAALVVERLELSGPLAVIGGRERYRIAGIAAMGGDGRPVLVSRFPYRNRILDVLLPLGEGLSSESSILFARRWREATAPRSLVPLVPQRYSLDVTQPEGKELFVASE